MKSTVAWEPARENCWLPLDEVHVWRAHLNDLSGQVEGLRQLLSPDERERADRFQFVADRSRHIVGRALAKILLGRCLDMPPSGIRLASNAFGKPALAADLGQAALNFNVAHSGELVLVALAYDRAVGVDIEAIRGDFDLDGLARMQFSENECLNLAALPAAQRTAAFFIYWTRREAYAKARGEGLGLALASFGAGFSMDLESHSIQIGHAPGDPRHWTLQALDAGENYKAALVIEGAERRLRCRDWAGQRFDR